MSTTAAKKGATTVEDEDGTPRETARGRQRSTPSRPVRSRPLRTKTHGIPGAALPRSSGGNTVVMTDSVTGMIIAAPTPMTPRSTKSARSPGLFQEAAASNKRPKRPRPAARTGLAADAVADRAPEQAQRREGQRVCRHDPLRLRLQRSPVLRAISRCWRR